MLHPGITVFVYLDFPAWHYALLIPDELLGKLTITLVVTIFWVLLRFYATFSHCMLTTEGCPLSTTPIHKMLCIFFFP